MKVAGVFLLLSLALLCFFSGAFSQGGQGKVVSNLKKAERMRNTQSKCSPQVSVYFPKDKRGWITRSEGRFPGKGVLRHRLFQINCGEFRDPKVFCTRESDPLCGSDGQTYGNKCAFCKALEKSSGKINLKHRGKC